jgi:uncharacterized membrane protein HdeD (DUF308 family)
VPRSALGWACSFEVPSAGYRSAGEPPGSSKILSEGVQMIILGVVLLVIGWFTGISLLTTLGAILAVVGVILLLLGSLGRPIAGRKSYW